MNINSAFWRLGSFLGRHFDKKDIDLSKYKGIKKFFASQKDKDRINKIK